jgi:hypothetical protein
MHICFIGQKLSRKEGKAGELMGKMEGNPKSGDEHI